MGNLGGFRACTWLIFHPITRGKTEQFPTEAHNHLLKAPDSFPGFPGWWGSPRKRMLGCMRLLGNILWILLGGLFIAIGWALIGLVLCITIIGIPLGLQCFKMATLTLTPFGKTVAYGGGIGSTLVNIVWVILVGWWMALSYVLAGLVNCITIIGIPFGLQSFKMAKLALWPFGAEIVNL